jgi:tetratricopeptide (TPR) repeat protein
LISVISNGSKSLQAHNAVFMWFQLFIEVLLRMHHKSSDRKELIDICKSNYEGNDEEMAIIDEFEKNYKAENAIWWYTREACFYRMMNKALRVQNYDVLFALRFFITDIAKQLKNEHEKYIRTSDTRNVIRVYRGQAIGVDELELMKNNVGEFLSMNSFLSTSRNRSTAAHFARMISTNDGNQSILFEIEIDPRLKTKACADINQISYYQNEDEVLIMLGALFRIESMVEDKKNRMWVARMSVASEDDYHLKETFAYMKERIGDDTNLDSLGKILLEMGEYRQAKKCYERMFEEFKLGLADTQVGLGWAHLRCEEYDQSLEHFEQALHIRRQILGKNHVKVAESYRYVGAGHYKKDNNDESIASLKKAIEIQENAPSVDPASLAQTYMMMAVVYDEEKESDLASEYYIKTLKVQKNSLPSDHPSIAVTYNNIGCFYRDNGDSTRALEHFKMSLEISRKILPPTHPKIIRTEDNIANLRKKLKN